MSSKLILIEGGELTSSRITHLLKILKLVSPLFKKIIIIHEGTELSFLHQKNIVVYGGLDKNIHKAESILKKIINIALIDLKKILIIQKTASPGDILLFIGIYQPFSILLVKLLGKKSYLFGGGFDVLRGIHKNKFVDELSLIFRWALQIAMLNCINKIILETPSVEKSYNLHHFVNKIIPTGALYVEEEFLELDSNNNKRLYDIAYIGVLSPEKGVDLFIESVKIVQKIKQINVIVVGDGMLRNYIESYIREYKLNKIVKLTGWISHSDIKSVLTQTNILLVPSKSEGLPNIILEAMASKTIVIATPVGGITDIIKNNETGFIINSNRPNFIASQTIQILNNPSLFDSIRKNARKIIVDEYTEKAAARRWSKLFSN